MIRRILERLSRNKQFKRTLPAAFGYAPLYVSPDSQLKYLRPGASGFDESLLTLALQEVKPRSFIWDVGANIGVFSVAAGALGATVLAIEPDIWLAEMIRASIRLSENQRLSVQVLPVAIFNKIGTATFLIANRGRAGNALASAGGRVQMGGVRERVLVPTLTLDALLVDFPAPDFVKIDVEGAEYEVLEGARRLLDVIRPRIYIEVGSEASDAVTGLFREKGYSLFDPLSPRAQRREIERCAYNTLAIPRELLPAPQVR